MERIVPKYYSVHFEVLLWEPIELSRLIPCNVLNANIREYLDHFTALYQHETDSDQQEAYEQCCWIMRRAIRCDGRIEHLKVIDDGRMSECLLCFDIMFNSIKQLTDF